MGVIVGASVFVAVGVVIGARVDVAVGVVVGAGVFVAAGVDIEPRTRRLSSATVPELKGWLACQGPPGTAHSAGAPFT